MGLGSHGYELLALRSWADAVFSHSVGAGNKRALKGMMTSRWAGQLHLRRPVEQDWITPVSQAYQERSRGGIGMCAPVPGDCHSEGWHWYGCTSAGWLIEVNVYLLSRCLLSAHCAKLWGIMETGRVVWTPDSVLFELCIPQAKPPLFIPNRLHDSSLPLLQGL